MTQQVVHAKVVLPTTSPLVDQVTIGMTFEATGSDAGITVDGPVGPLADDNLQDELVEFFNSTTGSGRVNKVANYLSNVIDRSTNACHIDFTDVTNTLDGGPAGSPFHVHPFTLEVPIAATNIPEGCAAVATLLSDFGTDPEIAPNITDIPTDDRAVDEGAPTVHPGRRRPRGRDRGRFYLGPLTTSALFTDPSTHRVTLGGQFQVDVLEALKDLALVNSGLNNQFSLVVWSRRNASVKQVKTIRMDDRPDYQRRRTDPSTVRTQRTIF